MRTKISRWFPHERALLFRHFAQWEDFKTWSRMPDEFGYEFMESETGEINKLVMTTYYSGNYLKSRFKSVYVEKDRETRTIVTSILDSDGSEILGTENSLVKEMYSCTRYIDAKEGTEITVNLYIKPFKFTYWLDSYLFLRDWRRRVYILMELLDDYLAEARDC